MSQGSLFTDGGRSAVLSPDGRYRYTLRRGVSPCGVGVVNFIMLNPSTADEVIDDPTIRRCRGFARSWGYAGLVVTNLFAFRATFPRDLGTVDDPIGPEADRHLIECAREASTVVCAWGAYHHAFGSRSGRPAWLARDRDVCRKLVEADIRLHALKVTDRGGHPCHPLYLNSSLEPQPWGPTS